jgi:hypothetical protein
MSALLQSVAEMQGGTGRLYVSIGTAKPAYFHNGIPYDAERRVCVENGAVHHYHQGLGYSVNSRLCRLSVDPDYFGNGAAPFSLADPAKLCDGGGLTHYNSGVGYSSVGRLSIVNSAPPDPLGPELVVNGGFDGTADGWSLGAGWAYGDNNIINTAAANFSEQTVVLTNNAVYRCVFTISAYTDGTYRMVLFGDNQRANGTNRTAAGTYVEDITLTGAGTVSNLVRIQAVQSGTATIDNISVREVIGG